MSKRSGGPAAGSTVPEPVDLERVRSAARSFGFQFIDGNDRLVFPWTNHVLVVRIDTSEFDNLIFESVVREHLTLAEIGAVAASLNHWNHDRLGPTASLRVGDDTEVEIHSRAAVLLEEGLSDEQLAEHVRLGVETTILMVRELLGEHPGLDSSGHPDAQDRRHRQDLAAAAADYPTPGPRRSAEDTVAVDPTHAEQDATMSDFTDPADENEEPAGDTPGAEQQQPPGEVTVDRVREVLGTLGITKTSGESEALIAWINGVLFGFFIDNGPSYLIKGHWDPGLDPDGDFLRVFLLCNDWNEESLTTKAYTHADDDGLQVRVEFTVSVGAGLTEAQLEHNTAVAINHILHALDTISTEVTGVSAVQWPH